MTQGRQAHEIHASACKGACLLDASCRQITHLALQGRQGPLLLEAQGTPVHAQVLPQFCPV